MLHSLLFLAVLAAALAGLWLGGRRDRGRKPFLGVLPSDFDFATYKRTEPK